MREWHVWGKSLASQLAYNNWVSSQPRRPSAAMLRARMPEIPWEDLSPEEEAAVISFYQGVAMDVRDRVRALDSATAPVPGPLMQDLPTSHRPQGHQQCNKRLASGL